MTKIFITSHGTISKGLQEGLHGYEITVGDRIHTDASGSSIIIHTAGNKDISSANPKLSIADNVLSTQKYIDQLTKSQHFIMISSLEAAAINNIYGATKFLAEELTKQAKKWSIVRLGTVLSKQSTFIKWVEQARNDEVINVTDLDCQRCVITLDKAVLEISRIFNFSECSYHEPPTVQFFIRDILKGIGLFLDRQIKYKETGLPAYESYEINSINSVPGTPKDFQRILYDFYNS